MLKTAYETFKKYRFFHESQWWNEACIGEFQDRMLKRIVRHAGKNVPYYRALFREIGLNTEKFRGREDMHKIPLLDKETVRTRKDELIAEGAEKYGIFWDSTSGSTGTPLRILIDRAANSAKLAALVRSYQWAGYSLGKRTFSLQSYYLRNGDTEINRLFNVLRFDSNKLKKESALNAIEKINKFKPRFFMGFPFDLSMLARFADEAGAKIHRPDSMVTYGETLSDIKRSLLKNAYSCKVFDYYSHHESVVMIAECEHGKKHLIEDFSYMEIDDANSELIGTGFYNYAMPLIRYKTRDTVVPSKSGNVCSCGRQFRTVERILGKQCDYLQTPDGRYLGAVMSHSIDKAKGVVMSQCIQDAPGHIWVHYIADDSFDGDSLTALEAGLRKRLGDEMNIDFRKVEQLEKSRGGKTPFILSKIGNEYI